MLATCSVCVGEIMHRIILAILGAFALFVQAPAPALAQETELLGGEDAVSPDARGEVVEVASARRGMPSGPRIISRELDRASEAFQAWRLQPWGDDVISLLGAGEHGHREPYVLEAGRQYVFQVACDSNCDDVDIEVLDAQGRPAQRDTSQTIWPAVSIEPQQGARYTVRVWLTRCAVDYCYVGLRAYRSAP